MTRPRLRDVADLAGVSMATASVVLNGDPRARISEPTRGRVKAAAEELGYRPQSSPRGLRVVEVALGPDPAGADALSLLEGVLKAAADCDRATAVLVANGAEDPTHRLQIDHRLRDGRIRLHPHDATASGAGGHERTVEVRLTPTGSSTGGVNGAVQPDDAGVACHLGGLLDRVGRTRVALVALGPEARLARQWVNAMERCSQPSDAVTVIIGGDAAAVRAALSDALSKPASERPHAVLCMSETSAGIAHDAAVEHGLAVPADVWIGARTAAPRQPHLAGRVVPIPLPTREMGRAAFRLLVADSTPTSRRPSWGRTTVVPFDAVRWSELPLGPQPDGHAGEPSGPPARQPLLHE